MISVIVPVLNEESVLRQNVARWRSLDGVGEVLVVDGGSTDNSASVAEAAGARVVYSERGRAIQLNHGASLARFERICFLHADCIPDPHALKEGVELLGCENNVAVVFRVRADRKGLGYGMVAAVANLRTRLFGISFGDAGMLAAAQTLQKVGGVPVQPIFEDLALSVRLRTLGRVRVTRAGIEVSSRRFSEQGVLRTSIKNFLLSAGYLLGVSPARLTRFYGDVR